MIEFDKDLIFRSVFAFLWIEFIWEFYLSLRQVESVFSRQCWPLRCFHWLFDWLEQHNVFKKTLKPPKELEEHFNEESFEKAREYGLHKSSFGLFHSIFNQLFTSVITNLSWFESN